MYYNVTEYISPRKAKRVAAKGIVATSGKSARFVSGRVEASRDADERGWCEYRFCLPGTLWCRSHHAHGCISRERKSEHVS